MAFLTDDQKNGIRDALLAQEKTGESVRSIAARFGVAVSTVSRAGKALDLQPELRSMTKSATEAKRADMAAQRAEVSALLLNEAHRAVLDMRRPSVIYNFGGKDNTYAEKAVDQPPFGDRRQLATTAAILLDKHRMLDQYDAQQGLSSAVDDWLIDRLGVRRGDAAEEGA